MKVLWWLALAFITTFSLAKKVKKIINSSAFDDNTHTIYLTKFAIGVGYGNIQIKYKRTSSQEPATDIQSMKFGLLKDENYPRFSQLQSCQEKQKLYSDVKDFFISGKTRGSKSFHIDEPEHDHFWYLFLFRCQRPKQMGDEGEIRLDILMRNNDSHFGGDEEYFLEGYTCLALLWLSFIFVYIKNILRSIKNQNDTTRLIIYCSYIFLGLAYFYRFLDLMLTSYNGEGTLFLTLLYNCIKHIVLGIANTVFVAIAWGWSLTHLKHEPYYIVMGVLTTMLSIACTAIEVFDEERQYKHYTYDGASGQILIITRTIIFLFFLFGVLRSLTMSIGKRKYFLKKFGLQGGIFMLGWPFSVFVGEVLLPPYMRNEFVTLVQEGVHLIAMAYICLLFALPENEYKKVNIKDEDGIMPDYIK